jgi:hypothetical protein
VSRQEVAIHAVTAGPGGDPGTLLAAHPRAATRGSWVIDPAHWDGLPDGRTRATVVDPPSQAAPAGSGDPVPGGPLAGLLTRHHAAGVHVARRSLASYTTATAGGES